MKKMTDKFLVITDSGQKHLVYEYTNILDASSFENPNATMPGLKELRTSDGKAVNFVSEGVYKIVVLDVIARRIP